MKSFYLPKLSPQELKEAGLCLAALIIEFDHRARSGPGGSVKATGLAGRGAQGGGGAGPILNNRPGFGLCRESGTEKTRNRKLRKKDGGTETRGRKGRSASVVRSQENNNFTN